jgi:cell division protein FtsB
VSVVAVVVFGPGLVNLLSLSWQERALDRKLRRLQEAHDELAKEHERLKSDAVYVEGLIRSTFKLAKPNELVIPSESLNSDEKTH